MEITFADLLTIPEIASFESSKCVLRLPHSNIIKIKNRYYECRIFAFDVDAKVTFEAYVIENDLSDVRLMKSDEMFRPDEMLTYSKKAPKEYVLISLRDVALECHTNTLEYTFG